MSDTVNCRSASELINTWLGLVNRSKDTCFSKMNIIGSSGIEIELTVARAAGVILDGWEIFLQKTTNRRTNSTLNDCACTILGWLDGDFTLEQIYQMLKLDDGEYLYTTPTKLYMKNKEFIYAVKLVGGSQTVH